MFDTINFVLRILTLAPLISITFVLGMEYFRHIDGNGLTRVRGSLLLLSIGIGAEMAIRLMGDISSIMNGISLQQWLADAQVLIVLSRMVMLVGVWGFYRLITKHNKNNG
jgi:hypothetical protein